MRVVHPSENDDLFEKCRRDGDIGHGVNVGVEQDRGAEIVRQQIHNEIVKHIVVLRIPHRRVDVGHRVCPCVLEGNLSVVGEQVPSRSIVDWHGGEPLPIEMASTIPNACEEDRQVVGFSIEFPFKRRNHFVV